jgi:hypothetical protein
LLEAAKLGQPECSTQMNFAWKRNPPAPPGGLEEILFAPYPHGGEHMQQHAALSGQNTKLG